MKFNIFEGARRIALLISVIVTVITLTALVVDDPYVSVQYSIAQPNGAFVKMQDSCPSDASLHYFSSKTSTGEDVSVHLCLLTMAFDKNNVRLIPYKIDEQGMIWGAASYSSEVSDYKKKVEARFKIPADDEYSVKKEISQRYRENWISGLGYLFAGLAVFAGVVWAIGWITRGFLGIPHGMDKRPD
jgi:hypothetical protein